ncbi:alpha/beta hydrolase [Verrucomicrobiales bacterium BCK34]|nr:alpha/beta hydrolase [Verrucomicrobiales bacterium BCK34]
MIPRIGRHFYVQAGRSVVVIREMNVNFQGVLAGVLILGFGTACFAQEEEKLPVAVTEYFDLAYVDGGDDRQKLDLYIPAREDKSKKLPLVVWIHGGGWAKGSRDGTGNCSWVLDEGYALASIGYRLTDVAPFPAQLDDCKAGIQWLKKNGAEFGVDADRIVVWGSSAGGHLVAMLGTTGDPEDSGDDIDGVIDWFGPTELLTMQEQRTLPVKLDANAPDSYESKLVGGTLQEVPEKAKAASPVTHVTKDDAPILILHGNQDPLVPLQQSYTLVKAYDAVEVPAQLVVIEGAGHGGPAFQTEGARKVMLEFLNKCTAVASD